MKTVRVSVSYCAIHLLISMSGDRAANGREVQHETTSRCTYMASRIIHFLCLAELGITGNKHIYSFLCLNMYHVGCGDMFIPGNNEECSRVLDKSSKTTQYRVHKPTV